MASGAATITLSMSCLPGDCMHATKAGTNAFATCATKGAASLRGTLEAAQSALDAANAELGANVSVGAVTFDCESISWDTDTPPATLGALTLINEFTYNTTRVVFPDRSATRVIFYNFGAANWMPTVPHPSQKDTPHCDRSCRACNMTWHRAGGGAPLPLGWSIPSAYYTYLESFRAEVPYSPALYSVPEPELMRRQFSLTAAMAQASGATWVVPYIGLGWGLRRAVLVSAGSTKHGQEKYTGGYTSNEVNYQYDEGYDVLLGAQMHLPEFEHSAYGPWEAATAAVLYPSPFDETTYGNWPSRHTQGSTNSMDHCESHLHIIHKPSFITQRQQKLTPACISAMTVIAYVRGAAGITSNDKSG